MKPTTPIPRFSTRRAAMSLLPAFALALDASAQITTLDFEGSPAMTFISGNPVPAFAQLSSQLLTTHGLLFSSDSSSPFVAVVGLGAGHATSGVNGIGGVDSSGLLSYATPFRVGFFLPSDPAIFAITDFVSISGDLLPFGSREVTLQAFDAFGNLLGSDTQIDDHALTLSVSHAGIHSIRISEVDTVAWDDLRFGPLVAVPEPSSIVLAGLGGLALLFRWRRQR